MQQRTNEIKTLMRRTASEIFEIGQKLLEVKQQLAHGNFMHWLNSEFDWSITTATRFMQVAEQFKFVTVTNLDIAACALYLLASPSTPDVARSEAIKRATQGETITRSTANALAKQYKF